MQNATFIGTNLCLSIITEKVHSYLLYKHFKLSCDIRPSSTYITILTLNCVVVYFLWETWHAIKDHLNTVILT